MADLSAVPTERHEPAALLPRFARLFLLAVVLPLLALILLALWHAREQRLEHLVQTMDVASAAISGELEDLVQAHLSALQMLAERRSRERSLDDVATWAADLAALRRHYPAIVSALATDAEGWVRLGDPQPPAAQPPRRSVANRCYFREPARTLRDHVSDGFRERAFGTDALVALSAPLLAPDGRFAGIVGGSIRIEPFAARHSAWLRSHGFELLLVDRSDKVLFASSTLPLRPLDRLPQPLPWTERLAARTDTPILQPGLLRGGEQAYARGRRLSNGWGLVLLMPQHRVNAELWRGAAIQLGLLLITVAAVLGIVGVRSRRQRRSLQKMLDRMQRFALGQPVAITPQEMPKELAPLAEALTCLSERANRSWDEVNRSLQERWRLHEELQLATRRLMAVQEDERRTLSRELHDDIGQSITAMKLVAQWLDDADPEQRKAAIAELVAIADQAIAKLRDLSLLLRPPQLDALGLDVALRSQIEALARNAPARLVLRLDPLPVRPSPAVELACFRVAQEAITNALRHADAKEVIISLNATPDDLLLEVRDDGRGIMPGHRRGLGLAVMRERVQQTGGTFEIISDGSGTRVRARFPLTAP